MKQLVVAIYAVVALALSPYCHAYEHLSPIFISQSEIAELSTSSNLGLDSPGNRLGVGTVTSEPAVASTSSTMTGGGLLLSIGLGILAGALLYNATKKDYVSTTPTSQGTINLNR